MYVEGLHVHIQVVDWECRTIAKCKLGLRNLHVRRCSGTKKICFYFPAIPSRHQDTGKDGTNNNKIQGGCTVNNIQKKRGEGIKVQAEMFLSGLAFPKFVYCNCRA